MPLTWSDFTALFLQKANHPGQTSSGKAILGPSHALVSGAGSDTHSPLHHPDRAAGARALMARMKDYSADDHRDAYHHHMGSALALQDKGHGPEHYDPHVKQAMMHHFAHAAMSGKK